MYATINEDYQVPNFTSGRQGRSVKAIVIHRAEGSKASVKSWFSKPASQASAHFLITLEGKIVSMVKTHDTAWHSGRVVRPIWIGLTQGINPNLDTIGIELEGYARDDIEPKQMYALCTLCADLCMTYGIVPSDFSLVFHREICADKECPGLALSKTRIVNLTRDLFDLVQQG